MAAPASIRFAPTVVEAEGLGKSYGARRALRDVSFTAAQGEMVAVVGPNGAGKTTLLGLLAGRLAPDEGSVPRLPDRIGWVPQQPALYPKLTVRENLTLFARLERAGDPAAAVVRMLEQSGLAERADDPVGALSGGARQRVNVAVGLLADPPLLLLDEPTAALDPRQRDALWRFLGGLAAGGTTILYTTHDIVEVERHADRVLVIADGELLFGGTPAQLQAAMGGERDFEAAFVAFLAERGH